MRRIELEIPKETKAMSITLVIDDGSQYTISTRVIDSVILKNNFIVVGKGKEKE